MNHFLSLFPSEKIVVNITSHLTPVSRFQETFTARLLVKKEKRTLELS